MVYSSSLRIDEVKAAVDLIANTILETFENKGKDINSIIELLGLSKASLEEPVTLSNEASIILNAINDLKDRVNNMNLIESNQVSQAIISPLEENINWDADPKLKFMKANQYTQGDRVLHSKFGKGKITNITNIENEIKATIMFERVGEKILLLSFASAHLRKYIDF